MGLAAVLLSVVSLIGIVFSKSIVCFLITLHTGAHFERARVDVVATEVPPGEYEVAKVARRSV